MTHPLIRSKSFTYQLLSGELEQTAAEKKYFEVFKTAYNGDYWQKGSGSLFPPSQGAGAADITVAIGQRFVYRNVVRECVDRVVKAFFGKSPHWRYQQNGNETEVSEEIDQELSNFWTKNDLSKELAKAFSSRLLVGRGGIRIYVPARFQNEEGFLEFSSIEDALKAIKVEFIPPERSRVLDDDGDPLSVVKYSVRENWETKDVVNLIEFSFLDDNELTWIGVIRENEGSKENPPALGYVKSTPLPLGANTVFFEIDGEPFVTDALYKNNQLLNLALTCAGFSLVDNGFGEVFITNTELETRPVRGLDGEVTEQPVKLRRGGGAVQSLIGIREVSEEGAESYQTPGVHFKDPTAITVFKDGKDLSYRACLEEAGQVYALISGDAAVSGESRIQAMKDFYLRIEEYKTEIDQLGSWLFTSVLRLASILSGTTTDIDVVYDSKIFVGDISQAEKNMLIAQYKAGVIGLETCRVLSGIDDPELERKIVEGEGDYTIEEVSLEEAARRVALANQLIGLLPERDIRKIAFGYSDKRLDEVDSQFQKEAELKLSASEEEQRGIEPNEGLEERGELGE